MKNIFIQLCLSLMLVSVSYALDLDYYPTYSRYLSMMSDFAADYPEICSIETIGQSVNERDIIAAKISDSIGQEEDEPEILFIAAMHGDEPTSYVIMLYLIDYLLTSYNSDSHVQNIVNNSEIWVCPLMNPDGIYYRGNNTVSGARRPNANGVDLEKTFLCPNTSAGYTPLSQPERDALIDFVNNHSFVLSADFHSGSEMVVYPWDCWRTNTADRQWWLDVCRNYAQTAQDYSPTGYMTGGDNGISNGYDLYPAYGSYMDYMNYFQGCRTSTIYLSNLKAISTSKFSDYWEYNVNSILGYIEESFSGIHGIVTDICGDPLDAEITILGHDTDNSQVYSDPDIGDYHRMVYPGTYTISISADEYEPQEIEVVVTEDTLTTQNFTLQSSIQPPDSYDCDGDGFMTAKGDCDDHNASISPGATEICGDGIDQDCDGSDLSCFAPPIPPSGVSASDGTLSGRVLVIWNPAAGATSYDIYRGDMPAWTGTMPQRIASLITDTSYNDTTAVSGNCYYYWVKAKNASGASRYSKFDSGYWGTAGAVLPPPTSVSATDGTVPGKVTITWNTVNGANLYEVWRATKLPSEGGKPSRLGFLAGTSFDDSSAVRGVTYYYWVKSRNSWGTGKYSIPDTGYHN